MSSMNSADLARIDALLPPAPQPAANYVPVREAGGLLYVAGQTPHVAGALSLRGRVGQDVTAEQARELARTAALNAVSALRAHLGSLTLVAGIVTVTGYVAAAPDFTRHPWVIDGASAALIECFGDDGIHARAAVGVASLPDGAPVEVSVVALRRGLG
ncbi:MAG: RidA family protein [Galactobacter sp.]